MTLIIGLIDKDGVYMGGDSQSTSNSHKFIDKNPKVVFAGKDGEFLIGSSGHSRARQLITYFDPPKRTDKDVYQYMVTDFIDSLRVCLLAGGYAEKNCNVEKQESFFLVGYEGRLFEIETNYQVQEFIQPYAAIGCAREYAVGALAVIEKLNRLMKPEEKLRLAYEAAEQHSCGIARPFNIFSLTRKIKIKRAKTP